MALALPATAAEPDPVAEKLDKALDAYKGEMKAYREKGTAWLEAREAAARKSGDRKRVDQVLEEQRLFRTVSDLPRTAPEDLRARPANAKAKLVKAYQSAVKEWTKAGDDARAKEAEKALTMVQAGVDFSLDRRVWAHDKGRFRMVGKGVWEELTPEGQTLKLVEHDRTASEVELQHTFTGKVVTLKLRDGLAAFQPEPTAPPRTLYAGKWSE
jgi:hypothetical protein